MPNAKFDAKSFNPEAFRYSVDRVPNLKMNELKKSRALSGNADIRAVFKGQFGTHYARLAISSTLLCLFEYDFLMMCIDCRVS
jgi:hypothetical protein